MLSEEVANTSFIVFGLTGQGIESKIYRTPPIRFLSVEIKYEIDRVSKHLSPTFFVTIFFVVSSKIRYFNKDGLRQNEPFTIL